MNEAITKNIIRKLIAGEDYYSEILNAIDADFLQYIVDFFKRIVKAKLSKVILQSVRGLLYFKQKPEVQIALALATRTSVTSDWTDIGWEFISKRNLSFQIRSPKRK